MAGISIRTPAGRSSGKRPFIVPSPASSAAPGGRAANHRLVILQRAGFHLCGQPGKPTASARIRDRFRPCLRPARDRRPDRMPPVPCARRPPLPDCRTDQLLAVLLTHFGQRHIAQRRWFQRIDRIRPHAGNQLQDIPHAAMAMNAGKPSVLADDADHRLRRIARRTRQKGVAASTARRRTRARRSATDGPGTRAPPVRCARESGEPVSRAADETARSR